MSLTKNIFRKGYEQNWSKKLFVLQKALSGQPPYHKTKDLSGEEIRGIFYEEDMPLSIKDSNIYEIESILKKCKWRARHQFLVK